MDKIVGRAAPDEFLATLEAMGDSHHGAMQIDAIRAYHFGSRFMVGACLLLPACHFGSRLMVGACLPATSAHDSWWVHACYCHYGSRFMVGGRHTACAAAGCGVGV